MSDINILGIDLAKNIMHLVGIDQKGKKISQSKVKRDDLLFYIKSSTDKNTLIAMEACGGSNYWSRKLQENGFNVKIVKTKDAKIYAQSKQKNDYNDALAITKAANDPELKSVKPKNIREQDISFIHKSRANTIAERVKKTNSMMSSLHEYGIVVGAKKAEFVRNCKTIIDTAFDEKYISKEVYEIFIMDCEEILKLMTKEMLLDKVIAHCNKNDNKAKKLIKVLGIGPINASCLSIAPIENYDNPRDFAASLGLVPKQFSSGDKVILGGITKQGDRYLRTMLIQAGRSVAMLAKKKIKHSKLSSSEDALVKWALKKFHENKPFNVICVGLANKLARIAHSIIVNGTDYQAA
jgi:transposase